MTVLLPPSETKRAGGAGRPLDLGALALAASLHEPRERVVDALVALSADENEAARVLKLSVRQRGDIADNARLRGAATMPAIDRYTGVLYDALDAATLPAPARAWLARHVLIHSAPFGPVGALDGIPSYRLAAGTSLPGLPPLRRVWAPAVTSALREAAPTFVLDLRSEAYAALGPVPDGMRGAYVRVVSEGPDGATRALNHFNKRAKGELVRALALTRPRATTLPGLCAWAAANGWTMRGGSPGEVELVV
ncbi:YaaA family protein [Microbacterium sp. No. 7]|uniref:YaaA family protein n=1 Tax=Microbacterium sp. No. 7 TaxID=1714373 RepID=UPI0006D1089E|nr:peroxide stress protein YaaA [Microbacterium sp. No. 7]